MAKLSPPEMPRWVVRRERLERLFSPGAHRPLTVVTGPPGAGKTTAMALWVAARSAPGRVAWMTLDGFDNNPGSFWRYLTEALRRAGLELPANLAAPISWPPEDQLHLRRLASVLAAQNQAITLVLDDIHLLTEPVILDGLAYVLRNASPRMRLVVASRMDPLLPLHRYRLTGELAEIRAAHLAFTVPEAKELLAQHDITLSAESLENLTRRTEGWAAGLRLAALSMAGHPDPERFVREFGADDATVTGYLMDEVLAAQPAHVRDVLLKTSILDRVSDELACELAGNGNAAGVIPELAEANCFVRPIGHGWYCFHPLFAEVLRLRLRRDTPHQVPQLRCQAARWLQRHGAVLEAARQAVAAGDWPLAARIAVRELAVGALIDPLGGESLAALFRGMPAEMPGEMPAESAAQEPAACIVAAAMAVRDQQDEAVTGWLRRAEGALDRGPDDARIPSRLAAAEIRFCLARRSGDLDAARAAAAQASALLARMPGDALARHPQARAKVLAQHGLVEMWAGDLAEAAGSLERAAACDTHDRAEYAAQRALAEAAQGRLRQAAELAAAATGPAGGRSVAGPRSAAREVVLAWASVERNQVREAGARLARAEEVLSVRPDKLVSAVASLVAARQRLARGEFRAAAETARGARSGWSLPSWLDRKLRLTEVQAFTAAGDNTSAIAAASRIASSEAPEAAVAQARVLMATGNPDAARQALAGVPAAANEASGQMETRLVEAELAYRGEDPASGRRFLAQALRLAEREQLWLPIVMQRTWIYPVLRCDPALAEAFRRLLHPAQPGRARTPADTRTPSHAEPVVVEPLTPKEREVLRHAAKMLSSEEIAAEMYISLNTVKSHLKSTFRKLGVGHRGQAVRRAQQLDLLLAHGHLADHAKAPDPGLRQAKARTGRGPCPAWPGQAGHYPDRVGGRAPPRGMMMVSTAGRPGDDSSGRLGLMHELLVSLPAGVAYVAGPDLIFQFANEQYRRMLGGRELIGLPLREALPELAQERLEAIGRVARTGQPFQGRESEIWIRRHGEDPDQLFVDFVHQPVRDDAGGVAGVLLYGSDVTQHVRDRRELEQRTAQLGESQERYRTLFETMPQGVVYYSADGAIIGVNPAASEILGMDLAGVTSWPIVPQGQAVREDGSPFPPEDMPVPVALRTGEIVDGVVAGVRHGRTGELRWVRITAVPDYRDKQGRPRRAYAIFTDLTEQRRTEAALRQSTALLGRLREANVLGVVVVGEQRIYEANDAYLDIIGYTRDDLEAGRIAWRKMTPRKWAAVEDKAIEQLRRAGACQPFEKEYIHKDGHLVPVLIGAAVIDRNPLRWASFVVDLTARERAERERAELLAREQAARMEADAARERLAFLLGAGDLVAATGSQRELLDQVAQLVVPALSDYCVIFLPTGQGTLRAASMVHRDPARTAILEGLREIDIPPDGPLIVQAAFTEGTTQLVRDVSARMPGWTRRARQVTDILKRVRPESAIATPLLIGQRRLGVAVLGRGVGRPRFTETDMAVITELSRRLAAGLANVETNQRLREVNAELSQATEALREQQRAKDRFIATLSHELRNPLAAIRAAVDLLTLDSPAGHPAIGVLDRQVSAMVRMADDLLDASRALTGRLAVVREPLDLREVVEAVTGDLRPAFDRTQRALIVSVPEDAVLVEGDQVRLAQLLGNLLNNALAYTRPGATITVRLASEPGTAAGEPGHANLVVRDDGIGFDPAQSEMLFEVFARAIPARAATGGFGEGAAAGGLGLGLGLVRSIAELHGGTASAHSQGPGKGAEFTVRLPLRTPQGGGQTPAARRHSPDRAPLRVLVIEDNADLATSYQQMLQRRGDQVTIADTGEKGLSAVQSQPFDLILCDIGLPDIDGRDIARQLRAHPRRSQMRIVAVSGFTQEADRQRSLEAGFDAHLAKPITLAHLDEVLSGRSPD